MAATTSLLGLVTPTQGTLSGTWGDTVNYGISDYVDISVAGTLTLTNDGAVTLANTTGSSSGNSITSSLTGAGTVTAQFAIVRVTGTLTTAKVVTGPSYSKTYTVVNAATGSTVTFKASGQTGVSIAVGESAFVYFNGTDYVKIVGTATAGAAGGSTTQVQYNNGGVLAGITGATTNGTALTLVAPILGTPASATLTNATGLPISTGVSGLGTGVATFLATPSSANLASAVTDETGSGALVFATSPTLVTPALGSPSSVGTMPAFTLGGTVSGGGNQINNVIIGTSTPLAGAFTTLTASSTLTVTGAGSIEGLTVGRGAGAVATNTAFGVDALDLNTTGLVNVAVGLQALYPNTTGSYNTAVGGGNPGITRGTLGFNTTGSYNTAFGASASENNTTGSNNTSVGYYALGSNTTASNNTAVGYQSLYTNTTGNYNTSVGYQAGYSNTTSDVNSFVGYQAGYSTSTGGANTAMGNAALNANVTGNYNAAFGDRALRLATGSNNASFGGLSSYSNTTGIQNTVVGSEALYSNTTGSFNTAVGYQAAYTNTTGSIVAVGIQSGYYSNGYANIAIGRAALYTTTTGSDNIAIGSFNAATGAAPALYLNATGSYNVAIGTSALANTTASNNTAVGYQAGYSNTTGSLTAVGYLSGYSNTTGTDNASLGIFSLRFNTTGSSNAGFGGYSLTNNTTGGNNTAVGMQALQANTTASNNTAVGYQAGYTNTTGANLVAIGYQAGYTSNANNSTYVGYYAGQTTTGTLNTFVGVNGVGYLVSSGAKNTIIGGFSGNSGGLDIRTASNYIVLSDGDGNPRGIFDNNGNYIVGTTTTSGAVSNTKRITAGTFSSFNGTLTSLSTGVAYTMFTMTADFTSYMVTVSGNASSTGYSETAIVHLNNTAVSVTIIADGGAIVISNSGFNIQVTQNSGGTLSELYWSAMRIL